MSSFRLLLEFSAPFLFNRSGITMLLLFIKCLIETLRYFMVWMMKFIATGTWFTHTLQF